MDCLTPKFAERNVSLPGIKQLQSTYTHQKSTRSKTDNGPHENLPLTAPLHACAYTAQTGDLHSHSRLDCCIRQLEWDPQGRKFGVRIFLDLFPQRKLTPFSLTIEMTKLPSRKVAIGDKLQLFICLKGLLKKMLMSNQVI